MSAYPKCRAVLRLALVAALAVPGCRGDRASSPDPAAPLKIYFIDVEGGQATLYVAPTGQSLLMDAGYPGFDGRDADRIAATAQQAGVSRIDALVVTHYHRDHVGGVPELAARLPIGTFIDHGPTVEQGEQAEALYGAYLEVVQASAGARHLLARPGDRLPIDGLDVRVVASDGAALSEPLDEAGQPNPLCADFVPRDPDLSENARSVGILVTHGRFRMLNLGDLTWNKEHELVCPDNLLGTVDLYLTTHHGLASSGLPALVHGVRPRVAAMNNGATKGGSPQAWRIVRNSPGLEDFWQLHYAVEAGDDHNAPEPFIANLDESTAYNLRVSARPDGGFTVTNERNGHSVTYEARE